MNRIREEIRNGRGKSAVLPPPRQGVYIKAYRDHPDHYGADESRWWRADVIVNGVIESTAWAMCRPDETDRQTLGAAITKARHKFARAIPIEIEED